MVALSTTVYPTEAYVLLQADWSGTILRDSFNRVSTQTWEPHADTGQVYSVQSGGAGDFPVNGIQGVINHAAVNTTKRLQAPIAALNIDATGVFYNATVPTGNDFLYQTMGRFVNINNLVDVRFTFAAAGTVSLVLREIIAGVPNASASTPITGLPTSGVFRWRFVANGTFLGARLWLDGTPEPSTWNLTFTTAWLTAGDLVTGTVVNAGVTNPTPITFFVDDLVVVDPNAITSDCAIVTRRNTVTGEIVPVRPYTSFNSDGALLLDCGLGLWWDTEPPLNVPLEYCVVGCDTATVVTANPGFETSAAGWTATGGALTQDCTVAKVGTCSGRLTPGGTLTNPSLSQTGFTLTAGRLTTLSTWAMSPQGWNSVLLRLVVVYSDLTSQTVETPLITLDDNEWRYLSISFVPRLPVTSATFSFIAAGLPPNTTLFNVDELEVTQLTDVTATDCDTVTVTSTSVWLKSPLHPCDDIEIGLCSPALEDCETDSRVSYVGTHDDTYSANTVLLGPVNRRRPIPVNQLRRDAAATLSLLAHDCDAKDAVLQANEPGDPLLFQAPTDYCIPDRYISVTELTESRFSVDQREDFRLMTLPYVTVDRPEGPMDGPCGVRIDDLCDIYTSWAALNIAGLTWTDLLLGSASPDGPGQTPPPAAARDWDQVNTEFVDWTAVDAGGTRDWNELRDGL